MSEVVGGITAVLMLGSVWAVCYVTYKILDACDDIAAIKKKVCDEGNV